jgi:feruloyl esterase
MATDNPDLSAFKARGGKIILWHGWSDQLIMPQGTARYYERVRQTVADADQFSRLYMVPGMAHCSGGTGVSEFGQVTSGIVAAEPKTDLFRALMAWSEKGEAPASITAARVDNGAVTHPAAVPLSAGGAPHRQRQHRRCRELPLHDPLS